MTATGSGACVDCHNPLAADQEWCHECGRARTIIHHAPDWRIGAAIVLGVIALAAGVTVFALVRVSNGADRSAAVALAPPPSRPSPSVAGTPAAKLLSWPAGLGGWTVVLSSSSSRADARTTAATLAGSVPNLGVLNSSEHPSMSPGRWVVFSGRYPTKAEADSAAASLLSHGRSGAHARMVEPPGGN
jgi:septal ring-binding cell division protein DamX